MLVRQAALAALLPLILSAQSPAVFVDSAKVLIQRDEPDSFVFRGRYTELPLDGAKTISFDVGQFSAQIPFEKFGSDADTGRLLYRDDTGQSPFLVSSVVIDPAAQTFAIEANGIALSGLPNPFALRFRVDGQSACTTLRVVRTAAYQHELATGTLDQSPCLATAPLGVDLIPAAQRTPVTFTLHLQAPADFDDTSVQLFRTDSDAQPSGEALCALSRVTESVYQCDFVVEEPDAVKIPLIVTARAASGRVFSTGFALYVVRPGAAGDEPQFTAIDAALAEANKNLGKSGDSVQARSRALIALRQIFPDPEHLTLAPAGLSIDGVSLDVVADSGLLFTVIRNNLGPPPPDVAQNALSAARQAPPPAAGRSPLFQITEPPPQPMCGEYQRDIVKNTKAILWSTWDFYFNFWGRSDDEFIVQPFKNSRCPQFDNVSIVSGDAATPESLSQLNDYGTVIIFSHGSVDKRTGQGVIWTTSGDADRAKANSMYYVSGTADFFANFFGLKLPSQGKVIGVTTSNPLMPKIERSVIFGGYCFSFFTSDKLKGNGATFFGYDDKSTTTFASNDVGSLLQRMLFRYEATRGGQDALKMVGNANLAYVGNPKLSAPQRGPSSRPFYAVSPGEVLGLKVDLDGAEMCDGTMQVKWKNTANAGTLRPAKQGGGQDEFVAPDTETNYTASSSGSTLSDQITADLKPNGEASDNPFDPIAARACTTIQPALKELVVSSIAVFNYSDEGPRSDSSPNQKVETGTPFESSDSSYDGVNTLRVEKVNSSTWRVTQRISAPKRDDIFTQALNTVLLRIRNGPGSLPVKIKVESTLAGACTGLDANFTGAGGTVFNRRNSRDCIGTWENVGGLTVAPQGSASFDLRTGGLGAKGLTTTAPADGTVITTIEFQ